jgi:hypothetical protein
MYRNFCHFFTNNKYRTVITQSRLVYFWQNAEFTFLPKHCKQVKVYMVPVLMVHTVLISHSRYRYQLDNERTRVSVVTLKTWNPFLLF